MHLDRLIIQLEVDFRSRPVRQNFADDVVIPLEVIRREQGKSNSAYIFRGQCSFEESVAKHKNMMANEPMRTLHVSNPNR